MDSDGEDTIEDKRQSKLDDEEKYTKSIQKEKQLKKEIAGDFVRAGEELSLTARSAETGINIYSISVVFEPGNAVH